MHQLNRFNPKNMTNVSEVNFKLIAKAGVCIFERRFKELSICGVREMSTSVEIEREVAAPGPTPLTASGDRDNQMATIHQMLSDVEKEIAADPVVEEPAESAAPEPTMIERARDDDDDPDQLESQINDLTYAIRSAKGLKVPSGYDATKLRRAH